MQLITDIYLILSVAGAFAVLDAFLPRSVRDNIANYVFGLHSATFSSFELSVAHAWIKFFLTKPYESLLRVLLYLAAVYFIFGTYLVFQGSLKTGLTFLPVQMATLAALCFLSLPYMYLNLFISKTVYYGFGENFHSIVRFIIDFIASLLAMLALGILAGRIILPASIASSTVEVSGMPIDGTMIVFGFAFAGGVVAGAYFYLRAAILVFGIVSRAAVGVTKLNFEVAVRSNVYEHPLTFLAFFSTSVFVLASHATAFFSP